MQGNRKRDTRPELALRRELHARGYRYRVNHPIRTDTRLVRADIAFTRWKVAVFVDGCFWHACPDHGTRPQSNTAYWDPKIRGNVARDRAVDEDLAAAGWTVIRLWEHLNASAAADEVERVLRAAFRRMTERTARS